MVYIFEGLLILNTLYQKYLANINFRQFTKECLTLWFYNFMKKMGKKKMIPMQEKTEQKQNSATIMISVD